MKKRLLSTLLTLCIVLVLLPVTALAAGTSGSCGDGVTWSYSNGTLTIRGTGSMDDYQYVDDVPWYDYLRQIHAIRIGDGVTSIGDYAFVVCHNLTNVTIPSSITTIGEYAFYECNSLTNVSIPDSVTSIGDWAFAYCGVLTNVSIPNSIASIGMCAFCNCDSLTSVTIPNSITSIRGSAFGGCRSLTNITIPDSVIAIEMGAFRDCRSLTDIYYSGSESQWKKIKIQSWNDELLKADIHYANGGASDTPGVPEPTELPGAPSDPKPTESPNTPSTPDATNVVLSPQNLAVDGKTVNCEKYNINGSNYFKLRDLAYALNDTGSQFGVGFDGATATVSITTGEAYTPAGGELAGGVDNSATTQPSSQAILINGERHDELTVYNIGGSNFFQLRELGDLLGFGVDFDADTNTALVFSAEK